ncbi:MAG: cytochrome P450 [Filomicrobium sp.]
MTTSTVIPPAPPVHPKELPPLQLLFGSIRNSLAIWPELAFDVDVHRKTLFGIKTLLVNDPSGVRHVMASHASNYVRPAMMARIMRPLLGRGLFLSEGGEWRRQRRQLAPCFTPQRVDVLLRHFFAAADDLISDLDGKFSADLSEAYQIVALNAALRALFSMPDRDHRNRVGGLVRQYINGPGRPQILDGFAKTEQSFSFSLRQRRAFQRKWAALVDDIVDERRKQARGGTHKDLLDLLLAARDPETHEPLTPAEVRDQSATMIFGGYETTARLLFWATYLLTLDQTEQARVREEVVRTPPEQITSYEGFEAWPRLRNVLLEAMRLYPPVPIIVREPIEEDEILGEQVSPGVLIYIVPWVLHRHRKHWERPTEFLPERFEAQTTPWTSGGAYLPFGAGPRICIGAVFAMAEAQIILAKMLERYTISTSEVRPVLPVGRLTTQPSYAPSFTLEKTAS